VSENVAKIVLEFIPKDATISYSLLKDLVTKWTPIKKDEEIREILNSLLKEGLIYEPKPNEYKRIEAPKTEEKKEKYMSFQGNLRFTKSGNIELRIFLPTNYLKVMFGLKKKRE
jgi:hypothetical protein